MALFFFLLLAVKLLGIWVAYRAHLPAHFPPETDLPRFGFEIYQLISRLALIINQKLPLFPSKLIFWLGSIETKTLFLKGPFLIFDLAIFLGVLVLAIGWVFKKRRFLIRLLTLSAVNLWILFFINSQRLSLFKEVRLLLSKPYKISGEVKLFTLAVLANALVIFLIPLWLKIKRRGVERKLLKKLRPVFSVKVLRPALLLFFLFFILDFSGALLKLSPSGNVAWQGYFIGPNGDERENRYLVFKKDFSLFFAPEKAQIHLFCQGDYRLYVNNRYVGRGGMATGQSLAYYESWSAESYLHRGRNSIKIECRNLYIDSLSQVKKPSALIFQLEAQRGILKKRVVSDGQWLVAEDQRYQPKTHEVSRNTGFQQIFKTSSKGFDLRKARIIDRPPLDPWRKLVASPIPPLEYGQVWPKALIDRGEFRENPKVVSADLARIIGDGFKISQNDFAAKGLEAGVMVEGETPYLVIDFGRIIVGYPQIEVKVGDEGQIDFGFAETMRDDGVPDVAKMVSQADRLIIGSSELGEFDFNWFERRAFRYLILIFRDFEKPVKLKNLSVSTVNYPADDQESSFSSSDDLLNQIFTVAKYSAKIARQDKIEDCPHRERGQYVGDLRIVSLSSYYNYSDKRLSKKALAEFGLSQEPDGFVRAVYPAGGKLIIPDYSAQWVSSIWEYYLFSGDKAFLKEIYPSAKKQIEGFVAYSDSDGLVRSQDGWWIFIDQGDQENNLDKSISLNFFYLEALNNMVNIARELGQTVDAERYLGVAGKVESSIAQKAASGEGLIDDCLSGNQPCRHFSRQTNYLAALNLSEDLVDKKRLLGQLLNNDSLPEIITPYFNAFVAESLFKNGFHQEGLDLIRDYWGAMIARGATSFWETYDPEQGKESTRFGESLVHGWSSGPAFLLPKWILGIRPLEPGFKRFQVKPVMAGLEFVTGWIPVGEEGFIAVACSQAENELTVEYNFPAETVVYLPTKTEAITLTSPGKYLFKLK